MTLKSLLVTVLLVISVDYGLAACNKKIIILPLFSGLTNCSFHGWPSSDCSGLLKYFLQDCSFEVQDKKREQIALLLPNYTRFTLCFLGTRGDCDSIAISLNDVVLKKGSFEIAKNLDRLLMADVNGPCTDGSMGIILTDIPDAKLDEYPDAAKLFRDNLTETINNFNTKYFLHTYIVWLGKNMSDPDYYPPSKLLDYADHFDNYTQFLELRMYDYLDLGSHASMCDTEFPKIHNISNGGSAGMSIPLRNGIIIGSSIIGVIILCLMVFCIFRVRKRYIESKLEFFADQHRSRARRLFFGDSRPSDEWEITPKDLKVEADVVLGAGISATVYKGHLKRKRDNQTVEIEVAVKFAHSYTDSSVRKDMIREIEFMKTLGYHENLLIMVGCVKDPENPVIATEYCANGDLLKILRKHELHYLTSEKCSEVDICYLLVDLLRIASQVCAGMTHLASLKYVHRDLAARNVLIMGDLTARVGDFGLCRLASESLYIQKGGKLPVKHMSLEALKFGEFSEKSDVWAFGVLLFEIFTGGSRPFADIETEELIKHLDAGGRPELPDEVPEQLIRMVNAKCFDKKPENRGTFAELQEEVDRILEMFDI